VKKTNYDFQKNDFEITWPGRVARHDLVYLAPPADPMQYGMPIGNGDIGASGAKTIKYVYLSQTG